MERRITFAPVEAVIADPAAVTEKYLDPGGGKAHIESSQNHSQGGKAQEGFVHEKVAMFDENPEVPSLAGGYYEDPNDSAKYQSDVDLVGFKGEDVNFTELVIGQEISEEESTLEHSESAVNPGNYERENSEESSDAEDSENHMDEEQSVAGNELNGNANFDDTKVEVEELSPENSKIEGNFKKVPISRPENNPEMSGKNVFSCISSEGDTELFGSLLNERARK